jgi:hypothetical protein
MSSKYGTIGPDGLIDMQRAMLDTVADDYEGRADIHARFVASNAPHPFDQVAMWSLQQRLCGLPALARERALARIGKGDDASRYTGIAASSVLTSYHNFGSGGYFHTVYAAQFGDQKAQIGNIINEYGSMDGSNGFAVANGRWVKVQPLGVDSDRAWAYVWVDGLYTHTDRRDLRRGLAIDAGTVPVVFRVQVTAGGRVVGTGTATTLPHRMRDSAEDIRAGFVADGTNDAIVTYHPA